MSRTLVLVRHGQSEFNAKNLFTGWTDVDLTLEGVEETKRVAARLHAAGLGVDRIYTSALKRTIRTAVVLRTAMAAEVPIVHARALNERDYGQLTGLNKDEARLRFGAEQVHRWRRSYREAPPAGESLRDTVARVLPYFLQEILPQVLADQTVLVIGHGNTVRALTFGLEALDEDEIAGVEFETGAAIAYTFDATARIVAKAMLTGD